MKKFKKRDLIVNIKVGDIVTDKFNGEQIEVTFVNQTFVDGKVINHVPKDVFDTGIRQLDKLSIQK